VLLVSLAAAVSITFAALLYLTLRRLYRPIDNLAHELRSPLTSIRGYAEYLKTAAATEEERWSATEYIIGESQRLSDVCDKLLVLANVREGEIAMEKVDIEMLFERVKIAYPSVEYEAPQRFVRGDAALLQSLASNLVSNAVKASPEGAVVKLSFRDNVLEVRDSGSGMSAQMAVRLNRPNYRPAGSHRGGNGLGIPLCHQIARAHHAQLVFASAPGGGTIARVIFTAS
jgi:signal transduction histidine kinase